MVGYTLKFEKACKDRNKRVYLPTNCYKLVWRHLDINQHATPRDSGYIRLGQSLYHSSWTILQSSTWEINTLIISEILF
jgi:hypothetical protein